MEKYYSKGLPPIDLHRLSVTPYGKFVCDPQLQCYLTQIQLDLVEIFKKVDVDITEWDFIVDNLGDWIDLRLKYFGKCKADIRCEESCLPCGYVKPGTPVSKDSNSLTRNKIKEVYEELSKVIVHYFKECTVFNVEVAHARDTILNSCVSGIIFASTDKIE